MIKSYQLFEKTGVAVTRRGTLVKGFWRTWRSCNLPERFRCCPAAIQSNRGTPGSPQSIHPRLRL